MDTIREGLAGCLWSVCSGRLSNAEQKVDSRDWFTGGIVSKAGTGTQVD